MHEQTLSPATFAKGTAPGLGERRTQALQRYLARATQFFILASAVLVGRAYGQRVPPANDNFANRLALIGANITTNGNNLYATSEPDEPNPSNLAGARSVWWTWTASRDGVLTVSTADSDFDTVLGVFTGNSLSNLSLAAFNDNDPVERIPTSRVTLNASAGMTYDIMVDGHLDSAGNIALALVLGPPQTVPPNDNFANRTVISGRRVNVSGSNRYASREPGEPRHAGTLGGKSVWWSWAAPASGGATVSTSGSRFDTVLGVYRGDSLSNLVFVAGNDDAPSTTSGESAVTFNVVAGTIYQIAVDGYDLAAGDVALRIVFGDGQPVPMNDNFENAIPLNDSSLTVTGSNAGASFQADEPMHAASFGGKSVWWVWTAPAAGFATVDTIGSDLDTLLGIYTGSTLLSLTEIASDDDGGGNATSAATFNTRPGLAYRIAVDGWDGASGRITLHISFRPAPAPNLFVFAQSQAQIQTNGFLLYLLAPAGFSYAIEYSATLGQWLGLQTNTPLVNGIITIQDPGAALEPRRFYRVLRLP